MRNISEVLLFSHNNEKSRIMRANNPHSNWELQGIQLLTKFTCFHDLKKKKKAKNQNKKPHFSFFFIQSILNQKQAPS